MKKYPHNEDIKIVLKDKADFVQHEGLNYLIPQWQLFADKYVITEDSLYEWLNDLDTRKIIDEILEVLSKTERRKVEVVLKPIDTKVIKNTFEINECIWGNEVEKSNKYDRRKNWYYYRINEKIFCNEIGKFSKR